MEFKNKHPFCDGRFHKLLENAELLNQDTGWMPFFIKEEEGVLPGYLKTHSYGEYIFDWAWADFYQKMGVPYYPKIIHALPFTPINAPKVLGGELDKLFEKSKEFYMQNNRVSGQHYLFTSREENKWLAQNDYLLKETMQYHFENIYENFEDFLGHLKTRKRKNIKKERKAFEESDLRVDWKEGSEIDPQTMLEVFKLYLTTIDKKHSYAYLNQKFFELLPKYMGENLKLALAYKDDNLIAMSLFIGGEDCLYGRYWGIDPLHEHEFPFLHFELCYYRGMEYCFKNKIPRFEAGAQGEHKLLRGFKPVVISSYHHLKEPSIHQAISKHLEEHNAHNREAIAQLSQHLPFKTCS